ncbi:MAG: acetylxylan esterase [Firmicutes bacterium]|nr:acetylxylan esterase [Candidatus Colimorpha enterica]
MENISPMSDPMYNRIAQFDGNVPSLRIKDGEDFAGWQKKAREELFSLLKLDRFEKCDPDPVIKKAENEDYTQYEVSFNTEKDFVANAVIRIPVKSRFEDGKIPSFICLQGHSTGMHISLGTPKYEGDEQTIKGGDRDFAVRIVREGYAAIALEQRGFGIEGGDETGPKCHVPAMSALILGRTLLGERVWDVMRTVDLVKAYFPMLDPEKIGIMGNSGGGTASVYSAAADERIAAAMPSCAFSGYKESIGVQFHCVCNFVPGIAEKFDMGDLAGLIAPRPLVVVSGKDDVIFPIAAAKREFSVTKEYYEKAGAGDMARHVVGPEGHRFYADLSWPVMKELTEW